MILYDPDAVVVHHVDASRVSKGYFRARCYQEGISKAIVARLSGGVAPLSVEARYVSHTLLAGASRALWSGATRADPTGPARAGAMADGLLHTAAGYAVGAVRGRRGARAAAAARLATAPLPRLVPVDG